MVKVKEIPPNLCSCKNKRSLPKSSLTDTRQMVDCSPQEVAVYRWTNYTNRQNRSNTILKGNHFEVDYKIRDQDC